MSSKSKRKQIIIDYLDDKESMKARRVYRANKGWLDEFNRIYEPNKIRSFDFNKIPTKAITKEKRKKELIDKMDGAYYNRPAPIERWSEEEVKQALREENLHQKGPEMDKAKEKWYKIIKQNKKCEHCGK